MFFQKSSLISGILALMSATQTYAANWINVGPIRSGDVTAFVDYQLKSSVPAGDVWHGGTPQGPSSYNNEADPLWVNIQRANLGPSDRVFVQIITYGKYCYRGDCGDKQQISERHLQYAQLGRFSGQMQPVTLGYQLNDGYALSNFQPSRYELVIWINGALYKDRLAIQTW